MTVVLRFLIGTVIVFCLAACSPKPLETSLPNSMRVASLPETQRHRPKTLSSDILIGIAMERVVGKRGFSIDGGEPIENNYRR
ncbi:MAG: hypothetical protein JXQ99_18415 [Hyphomicrobiaceae bacterium]